MTPELTAQQAQMVCDAHEINMDTDNEETDLFERNNPRLAEAYRALLAIASSECKAADALEAMSQPPQQVAGDWVDEFNRGDAITAHDPGTCGACHSIKYNPDTMVPSSGSELRQSAQLDKLDAYLTANYPDAQGDTVTDRAINALETMDIAAGMRHVPVRELSDAEIFRAISNVTAYHGSYELAVARAVLAAVKL